MKFFLNIKLIKIYLFLRVFFDFDKCKIVKNIIINLKNIIDFNFNLKKIKWKLDMKILYCFDDF